MFKIDNSLQSTVSNLSKKYIDSNITVTWIISQAEISRSELYTQDESLSFKKKTIGAKFLIFDVLTFFCLVNAVLTQKGK